MSFLYWLLLSVLACCGCYWTLDRRVVVGIGPRRILTALAVIVVLSPLYYEFPDNAVSYVLTFEGNKATPRPFGAFTPEFFGDFVNAPLKSASVWSGVTSLTPNPKVRKITIHLAASVTDPSLFYRIRSRRSMRSCEWTNGVCDEVARAVQFQMYEFTNSHSNELSVFYNPLDNYQVDKLRWVVEPWINPLLKKEGLRVSVVGFSVE